MTVAALAALVVAAGVASIRWLRVAQREHYLAGTVSRFAVRWWSLTSYAVGLGVLAIVSAIATLWVEPAALLVAMAVALGPPGLTMRGTTSQLAWTSRLRRLAAVVGFLIVLAVIGGYLIGTAVTAVAIIVLPLLIDLALALVAPVESRLGAPWVEQAAAALRQSGAQVVAITGSYGKTSTKGHVAWLLGATRQTLASPASFNNRMGLARAINEQMSGGVEVFVAEMGTYGPGEIADLCSWIPPDISVITAIGPIHLERFGSEDAIVAAKSEILAGSAIAVLNVDDSRLAALADREEGRRTVIRVATSPDRTADVLVSQEVVVRGEVMGPAPAGVHPGNVACAVGVVLALDIPAGEVVGRLGGLTEPQHRQTVGEGGSGVTVIDDTFNSNPAGARAALSKLAELPVTGRRVVVTPGMVEMGPRQFEENRAFAEEASRVADTLIVVGRTNRRSLLAGAHKTAVESTRSRQEAVEWVKSNLGPHDAVLYENDLPDHYP